MIPLLSSYFVPNSFLLLGMQRWLGKYGPCLQDLTVEGKRETEKVALRKQCVVKRKSPRTLRGSPSPDFGRIGSQWLLHKDLQGCERVCPIKRWGRSLSADATVGGDRKGCACRASSTENHSAQLRQGGQRGAWKVLGTNYPQPYKPHHRGGRIYRNLWLLECLSFKGKAVKAAAEIFDLNSCVDNAIAYWQQKYKYKTEEIWRRRGQVQPWSCLVWFLWDIRRVPVGSLIWKSEDTGWGITRIQQTTKESARMEEIPRENVGEEKGDQGRYTKA